MTLSFVAIAALAAIVATAAAMLVAFRGELFRAWQEPVLAAPVLIIESDDWGYGPPQQGRWLRELAGVLSRHRDNSGHPPVMTLALVLAGPDTARIAAGQCRRYHRRTLADPALQDVRSAISAGARDGLFALQLHGMEHFWPPVLLSAAQRDAAVRQWLTSPTLPATEELPAHLQSRWIDASALPSRELPPQSVEQAAAEEAAAFESACGAKAEVVVPPTFVWTPEVERAWARAGVRTVVTPGRRYGARDRLGAPVRSEARLYNGQRGASGLTYLVRDDYFEPALGHDAERALAALATKTRLGRPTLLETHRANFLGDAVMAARAVAEIDRLLGAALERAPRLRFMSSAELARCYSDRSPPVERRWLPRLRCFVLRLAESSPLRGTLKGLH